MEVRSQISELLTGNSEPQGEAPSTGEFITVSAATKRIAFAYERFRNTLEPDEADILRRKAISRILQRRLIEDKEPTVIAEQLLQELMRGNYIRPVSRVFAHHVGQRLSRSRRIVKHLQPEVANWFINILAVSIDRDLFPWRQEEELVSLMYHDTYQRVEWIDDLVEEKDRPTQLYMACHRALFQVDDYEIAYHYFVHHFPSWHNEEFGTEDVNYFAQEIPSFYKRIVAAIEHPNRDRVTLLLRPVAVPYRILRDVIKQNAESLEDSSNFENAVREAVAKRTQRLRDSMGKRAWHSILFLFFTKTIIAAIIEIPYELIFLQSVHWLALGVNIAFHPILLFFLTTSTRFPGSNNTDRIVEETKKIVTPDSILSTVIMRRARRYGAMTWTFFALVYVFLFLAIFWGLFTVLDMLGFSLIAMMLFVMFLGLVSFLAIRIRRSVTQIRILTPREGAIAAVVGFLSLPILELGRWLAQNIKQINVALFFMDRVLEAPFKVLIDVTEEWFIFVRDRREEIL